jgi:hypothetical protein
MKISLSHFALLAFIRRPSTVHRRRYFQLSSRLVMWACSKGWVRPLCGLPGMRVSVWTLMVSPFLRLRSGSISTLDLMVACSSLGFFFYPCGVLREWMGHFLVFMAFLTFLTLLWSNSIIIIVIIYLISFNKVRKYI